jgi:hypothetical protein
MDLIFGYRWPVAMYQARNTFPYMCQRQRIP